MDRRREALWMAEAWLKSREAMFNPSLASAIEILVAEARKHGRQDDVREFHKKFGLPCPERWVPVSPEQRELRKKIIREEANELCLAIEQNHPAKIVAEACDLIYVTYGALVVAGLDPSYAWGLIHEANMHKALSSGGINSKIIKPEGWQSPWTFILGHYGAQWIRDEDCCEKCGTYMVRSGKVWKCLNCGHTQPLDDGEGLATV